MTDEFLYCELERAWKAAEAVVGQVLHLARRRLCEPSAGTAERKLHFGTGGRDVSRRYAAQYSPVTKVKFGRA